MSTDTSTRTGLVEHRLGILLGSAWGESVTVTDLRRLTGGASRETWAFEAGRSGRADAVILRLARDDGMGVSLELEAAAMSAAAAGGVPVPEMYAVGRDEELGGTYMLMNLVPGETIPRRILREPEYADLHRGLARRLGEILARVHGATPGEGVPFDRVDDPLAALEIDLAGGAVPPPGLALGLRWLRDHRLPSRPVRLVHGDLRLGNVLVGHDDVEAVLDWELCHLGDPVEDLGWLCAKVWRFGSAAPVAGVGSREDLLDGYEAVAGWRPRDAELHWWELYGTVRWGLMCRVMAERHLSGAEPSVELVAIGRRSCEQEYDVLLALGHVEEGVEPQPAAAPVAVSPAVYGVPTLLDLLDGVAVFLRSGPVPLGGAIGFEARVAANLVDTARRELLLGPAAQEAHAAALARLGLSSEEQLSAAIADGSLDSRRAEVVDVVRAAVHARLAVSNPRHLTPPAERPARRTPPVTTPRRT